ncbi:hypothetical protein [Paraburkholderia strydomiana]|uniref:hypothetical protein n=1 Tax=Paraburkholderia strydomiana TaxID=1245417 RepID=UPI00203662E8|nr:hypothetical protein [Paraburkholderia strydomiana]
MRRADPTLDVEKFSRHVIAANRTGFLAPELLTAIANARLTGTLNRASHLGRWLLEHIGKNRHLAWRMAMPFLSSHQREARQTLRAVMDFRRCEEE